MSRSRKIVELDGFPVRGPSGSDLEFAFRSELLGNAAIDRGAVDFLELRKDSPFAVGGPLRHPCRNVRQLEPLAAVEPAAP